jgi:hypothetical protein
MQGHITHSDWLTTQSFEPSYDKKITAKFETKVFSKNIHGIIFGEMTWPAVYPNPLVSAAYYNEVLLNVSPKQSKTVDMIIYAKTLAKSIFISRWKWVGNIKTCDAINH